MTVPRWYVVRTRPRAESSAADRINQDGIEAFSPLITMSGVNNRNNLTPLFPGYIFIKLESDSYRCPSFQSNPDVLGLLNFGGDAPWLPDEVINELKLKCTGLNEQGGIWRRYQPGDWVQLVSSTLQGTGQVIEDGKSSSAPVRIMLQLFERLVPAQVSRQNLQPLEITPKKINAPRKTRGRGRWIQGFGPRTLIPG